MRISDWSSDVCASDLEQAGPSTVPGEVVLGPAEVVDAAVGPEAHGLLEHPAAVVALLADEHERVVLHADRRVEPAEAGAGLAGQAPRRLGLAHRTDPPRPVERKSTRLNSSH